MKNRPTFEPHEDFNFDPKKIGHLSRQEFIRFVRESHEHMRKLSRIIERYGLTLDEYLEQWDGNIESFDDDVKVLLGEWIEDGTLDHIINENLMSIKADKSYVDDLNESVTAQLAQTNQQFNQAVGAVTEDSEVVMARGDKDILGERLDEFEVNLDKTTRIYSKMLSSDDLINGWEIGDVTGVHLRRQGNYVIFTSSDIIGITGREATSDFFIDLPLGFRIAGLGNYGRVGTFWEGNQQVQIRKNFNRLGASSRSGSLDGSFVWMTTDPYPEN